MLAEIRALVAEGVLEVTLLGQNVNSYGVGVRRPAGVRQAAAGLRRASRAWSGSGSPRRTRGTSPTTSSRRWPRRPTSCRSCTCRSSRARTRCCGPCAAPTGGTSTWPSSTGSAPPCPRRRSPPTSSSASPARPSSDFCDTLDVVRRARFAGAFTFQYSIRPGTPAAELPDQVPPEVVRDRYERLAALVAEVSWQENQKLAGAPGRGAGRRRRGPQGRARRTGCRAGPPTTGWSTSRPAPAPAPRPGDMVTTVVTRARAELPAGRRRAAQRPPHPRRRRLGRPAARRSRRSRDGAGQEQRAARHAGPPSRLRRHLSLTGGSHAGAGPGGRRADGRREVRALAAPGPGPRRRGRSTPTPCSCTGAWTSAPPS